MRADQRKYHYIYKVTRVDGTYYIGMHSTDNLDDGYTGSGQRLWKSIRKHGRMAHTKEIIEFLPNRKALADREEEIVTKDVVSDTQCMNLRPGGRGPDDHQRITARELLNKEWADPVKRASRSKSMSTGAVNRYKRADEKIAASVRSAAMWKKDHTAQKKATQRGQRTWREENPEKFAARQALGTKGKIWITNGTHSRMIVGDVPNGWKKGRA